jgi:ribosomal-protein-alanine N-acetyltransferase
MDIPSFLTPRLLLRSFTSFDFEQLQSFLIDRDVIRYFPRTEPWPNGIVKKWISEQQDQWDKHGYGWWALELKDNHKLIGWCGLGFLDETKETEILYLLGKPFWGKGFATEATHFSINYAFDEVKLDTVIGLVHPDNPMSQRVLEKTGLSFDNRAQYFGLELYKYSISKDEFTTRLERMKK